MIISLGVIIVGLFTLKMYYAIGNYKFHRIVEQSKNDIMQDLSKNNEVEHKVLQRENTKIHYFVSGKSNSETIVFLHPAFGDHNCFDNQIDFFSQNFCVITIDMLGHGLSVIGKSKDKITSTPEHIIEILELERIEKLHIVGVSLGSLLAQDFALKYPTKILSLSALGGYNINKQQKELAKLQRKEMFKWLFKMVFSMDAFRRYTATVSAFNNSEQVHFYESAKHFTRKSFTVMSGLNKLIENRNIQKNYPLLIMFGEKDSDLAKKMAKQWNEEDSNSELFSIENAGHCANMDNPSLFNEILMNFIAKTKRTVL